mmetsp:Transcript_15176/g.22068  ORF Transcript_15176/g.22068 Transcript_15176/m.22068 type:complete len:437 (+) Transcript_15176:3-1313(+)
MEEQGDTVISEVEVPNYLEEYLNIAFNFFETEDYESSLDALCQGEELIEAIASQGGSVHPNYVICILNNLAATYRKLGDLSNAAAYLDASIQNCNNFKNNYTSLQNKVLGEKVKKGKFLCGAYLQLSQIYLEMGNKQEAAKQAKSALIHIQVALENTLKLCKAQLTTHKALISSARIRKRVLNPQYNLLGSPHYLQNYETISKIKPVLEFLVTSECSVNKPRSFKTTYREALGVQKENTWVVNFSTEELLELQFVSFEQLEPEFSIETEVTPKSVILKLLLVITTYFTTGKQIQLSAEQPFSRHSKKESYFWFKKAMKLCLQFLPTNSQISKQVRHKFSTLNKDIKSSKKIEKEIKKKVRSSRQLEFPVKNTMNSSNNRSHTSFLRRRQENTPSRLQSRSFLKSKDPEKSFKADCRSLSSQKKDKMPALDIFSKHC